MCQSRAEGGLRCAAHTRPGYLTALNAVIASEYSTGAEITLQVATQAYAATPNGYKATSADIDRLVNAGKIEASIALAVAREQGHNDYLASKEASKAIEMEQRRGEAIAWAQNIPEGDEATQAYVRLIAAELNRDEQTIALSIYDPAIAAMNNLLLGPDSAEILESRFIVARPDGTYVGTPADPLRARTIADLERRTASARRAKRQTHETVDAEGRRWVRYENNDHSEVLQSVNYDSDNKTLEVSLFARDTDINQKGPSYAYKNVDPAMFNALISARSMGRVFAFVFSGSANNADMTGATPRNYSFALQVANFMAPTSNARGPVPRNLSSLIWRQK
jgi:hypothetical protein